MQSFMVAHTIILRLLAAIFLLAGVAHFTTMRKFFVAIVPKALPFPTAIVQVTGVLEILGGAGFLVPVPEITRLTGIALILFLIAVFPANIEAARQRMPYSNPLWARALAQVVLIGLIAWTTLVS